MDAKAAVQKVAMTAEVSVVVMVLMLVGKKAER